MSTSPGSGELAPPRKGCWVSSEKGGGQSTLLEELFRAEGMDDFIVYDSEDEEEEEAEGSADDHAQHKELNSLLKVCLKQSL